MVGIGISTTMKVTIAITLLVAAVAGMSDAKLVKVNSLEDSGSGKSSVKGIRSQHHRNLNNDCGTCMSACNDDLVKDPPGCQQNCKNTDCRPNGAKAEKMSMPTRK